MQVKMGVNGTKYPIEMSMTSKDMEVFSSTCKYSNGTVFEGNTHLKVPTKNVLPIEKTSFTE